MGFVCCKNIQMEHGGSEEPQHQSQAPGCSTSATYFWFVWKQTPLLHRGLNRRFQQDENVHGSLNKETSVFFFSQNPFNCALINFNFMPFKATVVQEKRQSHKKSCVWYRALGCKWLWLIAAFRHPAWSGRGELLEGRRGTGAKAKDEVPIKFVKAAQCRELPHLHYGLRSEILTLKRRSCHHDADGLCLHLVLNEIS